jgi:hypothetical protein
MIKTLFSRLNGHGNDPASLSAMMNQLAADRVQAVEVHAARLAERHRLLLDDATDTEIDKIEREIDRAAVRIEKLDAAEPVLREKLRQAVAVKRQATVAALRAELAPAAADLIVAMRGAKRTFDAYIGVCRKFFDAGLGTECSALSATPPHLKESPFCSPELIDRFEVEVERLSQAPLPQAPQVATDPHFTRSPQEVTDAILEAARSKRPAIVRPVPAVKPPPVLAAPPPLPRPLRRDPAPGDGVLQVEFLRRGVELNDGTRPSVGDRVNLPNELARKLVENGAAGFVPAPAASIAIEQKPSGEQA